MLLFHEQGPRVRTFSIYRPSEWPSLGCWSLALFPWSYWAAAAANGTDFPSSKLCIFVTPLNWKPAWKGQLRHIPLWQQPLFTSAPLVTWLSPSRVHTHKHLENISSKNSFRGRSLNLTASVKYKHWNWTELTSFTLSHGLLLRDTKVTL